MGNLFKYLFLLLSFAFIISCRDNDDSSVNNNGDGRDYSTLSEKDWQTKVKVYSVFNKDSVKVLLRTEYYSGGDGSKNYIYGKIYGAKYPYWYFDEMETSFFERFGRLIKSEWESYLDTVCYYPNGLVKSLERYYVNSDTKAKTLLTRKLFYYDNENRLEVRKEYNSSGGFDSLISHFSYDGAKVSRMFKYYKDAVDYDYSLDYEYNASGLASKIKYYSNWTRTYVSNFDLIYNANGDMTEINGGSTVYRFNYENKALKNVVNSANEKIYEYEYDNKGRLYKRFSRLDPTTLQFILYEYETR